MQATDMHALLASLKIDEDPTYLQTLTIFLRSLEFRNSSVWWTRLEHDEISGS